MRVAKWGNSLALRLPQTVVDGLKLKEGDDVEVVIAGRQQFGIARNGKRDAAIAKLKAMNWELPEGFRFDRDEANAR